MHELSRNKIVKNSRIAPECLHSFSQLETLALVLVKNTKKKVYVIAFDFQIFARFSPLNRLSIFLLHSPIEP